MNLKDETRIVWLDPDVTKLPFVREKSALGLRKVGRPYWPDHERLVGYAELSPEAERAGGFIRRVWVLHDTDPGAGMRPEARVAYADDQGLVACCPVEAVLPETVAAGVASTSAGEELKRAPRRAPAPTTIRPGTRGRKA